MPDLHNFCQTKHNSTWMILVYFCACCKKSPAGEKGPTRRCRGRDRWLCLHRIRGVQILADLFARALVVDHYCGPRVQPLSAVFGGEEALGRGGAVLVVFSPGDFCPCQNVSVGSILLKMTCHMSLLWISMNTYHISGRKSRVDH